VPKTIWRQLMQKKLGAGQNDVTPFWRVEHNYCKMLWDVIDPSTIKVRLTSSIDVFYNKLNRFSKLKLKIENPIIFFIQ